MDRHHGIIMSGGSSHTPMDIYDATGGAAGGAPAGSTTPARLAYTSEKHPRRTLDAVTVLRKHRELCDVVLAVGSRKIYAHRVVLSACSPYFHAMFTSELCESRQNEVNIRDVDEVSVVVIA